MQIKIMRGKRLSLDALLYGLLYGALLGSVSLVNAIAEELPSLDFLEYLGSEENKVDDQWTSPVDLDIEQYLVANHALVKAPQNSPLENGEDNEHE